MTTGKNTSSYVTIFSLTNRGIFNNYVDQVLPNFDSPTPSSGQNLTLYILNVPFVIFPLVDFPLTPTPLFLST